MWGERIWARWFDPPFDTRGDGILAGVLGGGIALAGALLLWWRLDAVLSAQEETFVSLAMGALIAAFVGLPLLALSRALRARTAIGLCMLGLAAAIYALAARPVLLVAPEDYADTAGHRYERIHTFGGKEVGREPVSAAQVSVERWTAAAGMTLSTAINLGLLALFPLAAGLRGRVSLGERNEADELPRTARPPFLPAVFGRCASCDRLVIERWRRCRWCGALLPSAYRHRPDAEATLTLVAWLGVVVAGFTALAGIVTYYEDPLLGASLVIGAAVFLVVHACLKWWSWALLPVRLAWPVLALAIVVVFWQTPLVALLTAGLPLAVTLKLAQLGGGLSAYVHGALERDVDVLRPDDALDGNACRRCGAPGASIVAPMWCFSMILVTTKRPGRPQLLCPFHARLAALPATVVAFLTGWWGIPWGLLWTPGVLLANLSNGGVPVDRQAALEQQLREREGPLSIPRREALAFALTFLAVVLWMAFGRAGR